MARAFVRGKIINGLVLLNRYRANHRRAVIDVRPLSQTIESLQTCPDLATLRGLEGQAARHYFEGLRAMVSVDWGFERRQRRPPRDPVNALLSFGYTLLGNEIQALLDGMGFDPYLGFLHQLDYGRPSLALDLME